MADETQLLELQEDIIELISLARDQLYLFAYENSLICVELAIAMLRVLLPSHSQTMALAVDLLHEIRIAYQASLVANLRTSILETDCSDVCAICLEQPNRSQEVKVLPCTHTFHVICIDTWLSNNSTCPVCRMDLHRK
uniref:RING-type domain-containing protein n=1 Tax=Strigamia maritima TaxID=126957 RepID=T1IKM8_STRMM